MSDDKMTKNELIKEALGTPWGKEMLWEAICPGGIQNQIDLKTPIGLLFGEIFAPLIEAVKNGDEEMIALLRSKKY